ncbi:MAG TPA: pitrilysin family protein [Thermoanaerobaculia bacterium]|nr:pitrilysin family protein [Thermoanaerobaculia bacterium]
MRITRTLIFLLLVAVSATAATPFPTLNYKHRVLPNGLEIYSVQDRSTPTVAIHVWYRVGSKSDPEGRSGFAHLFEHMMFKSTAHMPSEMMDRLTEDVGGFNNASTFDDYTAYYEVVPSNYLETLLWAEADRMGSLNVDEANFKSERDVVKEEFRLRVLAPPYGRLFYAIEKNSFTTHPYRRPGFGSIEELDAASIEDVRAFHSTFYRPDNAFMMVVGDFDQEQLDGWVDKYFTPIPKPDTAIPRVTTKEPARVADKRVDERAPNVPLPGLALTWLAPGQSNPDSYPLHLASTILGEGESSRLNQALVYKSAIATDLNVDADLREDLGLFTMLIVMASEHSPEEGEKAALAELQKFAANPVSASELEKAKNLTITSALRERETNNGKAFALGEAIVLQKNADEVNRGLQKLQAVTPADVQRATKTYLEEAKRLTILYRDENEKGGKQ